MTGRVSTAFDGLLTAGVHHAVRNTDAQTGFEQHGFLNLLLAAEAVGAEAEVSDIAALLECRSPDGLVRWVTALDDERIASARTRFVSFGTCSIIEPLGELAELGLLPQFVPRAGALGVHS